MDSDQQSKRHFVRRFRASDWTLVCLLAIVPACQHSPPSVASAQAATLPPRAAAATKDSKPVIGAPTPADRAHQDAAMAEVLRLQAEAQKVLDDLAQLRADSAAKNDSTAPVKLPAGAEPTAVSFPADPSPRPPEIRWNIPGAPPSAGAGQPELPTSESAVKQPQFETADAETTDDVAQQPLATDAPAGLTLRSDILDEPLLAGSATQVDRAAVLIVELCAELHRQAAYSDRPMRELLVIAATTMLDPERAVDPKQIPGLTNRDREVLRLMQEFFAGLGRELESRGDPEQIAAAVATLSRAISQQPTVRLSNAGMCWRVEGFGRYEPFSANSFLAHSKQQVIIYVEVGDFASKQNPAGEWVTRLSQKLIIYSDRDGIPVWQEDWQAAVDRTKNRRTDFFLTQIMTLPEALSVGKYQLKVRMRDEESKAEAETTIPFEMVADPKLAAGMQ